MLLSGACLVLQVAGTDYGAGIDIGNCDRMARPGRCPALARLPQAQPRCSVVDRRDVGCGRGSVYRACGVPTCQRQRPGGALPRPGSPSDGRPGSTARGRGSTPRGIRGREPRFVGSRDISRCPTNREFPDARTTAVVECGASRRQQAEEARCSARPPAAHCSGCRCWSTLLLVAGCGELRRARPAEADGARSPRRPVRHRPGSRQERVGRRTPTPTRPGTRPPPARCRSRTRLPRARSGRSSRGPRLGDDDDGGATCSTASAASIDRTQVQGSRPGFPARGCRQGLCRDAAPPEVPTPPPWQRSDRTARS